MEFKIGDVVQLKSGGPLMTVSSVGEKSTVNCYWFNEKSGEYELKYASFKPDMLKAK